MKDKKDIEPFSPVCVFCARWNPEVDQNICEAFPNGIPVQIWQGKDKHQTIHPGDGGKLFVPIEGAVIPNDKV